MECRSPAIGPPLMVILKETIAQLMLIAYIMLPIAWYFLH